MGIIPFDEYSILTNKTCSQVEDTLRKNITKKSRFIVTHNLPFEGCYDNGVYLLNRVHTGRINLNSPIIEVSIKTAPKGSLVYITHRLHPLSTTSLIFIFIIFAIFVVLSIIKADLLLLIFSAIFIFANYGIVLWNYSVHRKKAKEVFLKILAGHVRHQ